MFWPMLAAQLVVTDPVKAATFFSPAALSQPARGCGNRPKWPTVSAFETSWYSAVWIRAGEPALVAGASASSLRTWRFTNIPTWTAPTIFRITEQKDGRLRLIAKQLSGRGGYDPGVLKQKVDRDLTADEQSLFRTMLTLVDDVLARPSDDCIVVFDGDQLILERTQSGQYLIGQRVCDEGRPMANMNGLLSNMVSWVRPTSGPVQGRKAP